MATPTATPPSFLSTERRKAILERLDRAEEGSCWKGRGVSLSIGTLSVALGVTAVALNVVDFSSWAGDAVGSTLLPFFAGGLLWNGVQMIAPRKPSNLLNDLLAGYGVPLFLTVTQVYNNLTTPSDATRTGFFAPLNGLIGAGVSSFFYTFLTRKKSESNDFMPLNAKMEPSSEGSKISVPLLDQSSTRLTWNAAWGVLGLAATVAGFVMPQLELMRDFGIILVGDCIGQVSSELSWKRASRMLHGDGRLREPGSVNPVSPYYKTAEKVLALARFFPGILIVGAATLASHQVLAVSTILYLLTGALVGYQKKTALLRFTQVDENELLELKERRQLPQGTFMRRANLAGRAAKWAFATLGLGWFLGFSLAGWSFQSMSFQKIPAVDQAVLTAFTVALYSSYAFATYVKKRFKASHESRFVNAAYFNLSYAQGIPLVFLYLIGKMELNNQYLNSGAVPADVLASLGYFSFGWGVGLEAVNRHHFPSPRVVSSLFAALGCKFLMQQMLHQV